MTEKHTLTPFLEDLLSIVSETCAPSATGWQYALVQRLYEEIYSPIDPGATITAEDEEKKHLRLLAVERRIYASEPLRSRDHETDWTN